MLKYKIEGIDCESCAQLIKMNLEDAGFTGIEVDLTEQMLLVPDEQKAHLVKIKQAVDTAGHYKLLIN